MRSIVVSPLRVFFYTTAQFILLLVMIANNERVHLAISLVVVLTTFLSSIFLIISLFKKILLAAKRRREISSDNTQSHSLKYPIVLNLVLLAILGYSIHLEMERDKADIFKPVAKSDLIGDWRQRDVLDGEKKLNRDHYYISGPAFFRFNSDNTMTQVIVETALPADDKNHLTSYLYLSTTPYKHSYILKDERSGLAEFIDQNGKRYPVKLSSVSEEIESKNLPKQIADKATNFAISKGDVLVGYLNPAGGVDYFRVLTRVDESYFNKAQ